jgi:hypothetical protein
MGESRHGESCVVVVLLSPLSVVEKFFWENQFPPPPPQINKVRRRLWMGFLDFFVA